MVTPSVPPPARRKFPGRSLSVGLSVCLALSRRVLAQPNPDLEKPYAHLALQIQQEPNSYENIIEIDPLDLAEMFGNVGGFWGELARGGTIDRRDEDGRGNHGQEAHTRRAYVLIKGNRDGGHPKKRNICGGRAPRFLFVLHQPLGRRQLHHFGSVFRFSLKFFGGGGRGVPKCKICQTRTYVMFFLDAYAEPPLVVLRLRGRTPPSA